MQPQMRIKYRRHLPHCYLDETVSEAECGVRVVVPDGWYYDTID